MLTTLFLFTAALVSGSFSLVAALSAAVVNTAFVWVPVVFVLSSIIGLGARDWGRCL
jgi:hypothetical protein